MEIRGVRIWNGRPVTDRQVETILNTALDEGINFTDTANDYRRSDTCAARQCSETSSANTLLPFQPLDSVLATPLLSCDKRHGTRVL